MTAKFTRRAIIGAAAPLLLAQNTPTPEPWQATVKVSVSGDDDLRHSILNNVLRELSTLSGVEISDSDPDYEIQIIGGFLHNKLHEKTGYGFSYLCTHVYLASKATAIRAELSPVMRTAFDTVYREVHVIESFGLRSGGLDDLRSDCQNLVAEFDNEVLEPARSARTERQDRTR